jgi:hypothetical protein
VVLSCLILSTWVTFSSIPQVYEPDRAWLFLCIVLLDCLLLLVHMYDSMPTMYTIVMGRLTFVMLANLCLSYSYYSLKDRLEEYVHRTEFQIVAGPSAP